MFKTIKENVVGEITEKKSKFIANIFYVESIEEAEEIIKQTKKKYYDARHNCFAYKINKDNISRFSDDGEPSGTAGAPILNILNGRELDNILVIVTRYFGGILLGTGGLVRAYSDATIDALEKAILVSKVYGNICTLEMDYPEFENVKYYLKNENIDIKKSEYAEKIKVTVELTDEEVERIKEKIDSRSLNILEFEIIDKKYILKEV